MNDNINPSKLKNFQKELLKAPELKRFVCIANVMLYLPFKDGLLRCISMDKVKYSENRFECQAIFLPLYCHLEGFELTFSRNILRSKNHNMPIDRYSWRLKDKDELIEAIVEQAIPYLDIAETSKNFAERSRKIVQYNSGDDTEVVAMSFLKSKRRFRANLLIQKLICEHWFGKVSLEQYQRLKATRDLMNRSVNECNIFFDDRIADNIKLLKLEGIQDYAE